MNDFEYLSVLLSIVLGLGITQLLAGFAQWLVLRSSVRPYVPAIAWALFLLLVLVQTWWSMFGLRTWRTWTFLQFAVVLLQPIILYLMAWLVLPGQGSAEQDLRTHFLRHRRWFFGLFLGLLAASVLKDVVRSGVLPEWPNLGFHAALFAIGVVALATARDVLQKIVSVVALGLLTAYVGLLFANLA